MIRKDLYAYAKANWEDYLAPVTDLSRNRHSGRPLVKSAAELYDFDAICLAQFPANKAPTSADGIDITPRSIRLIEFKSGFRKKISKYNFDQEQGRCQDAGRICEDYWKLFFKNQEKETQALISSIRFKALESYLTLEKQFLPGCPDAPREVSVKFTAVVDADPVDRMTDILAEAARRQESGDNPVAAVRQALRRLTDLRDAGGNTYCYDSIEVLSAGEYADELGRTS